MLAGLLGGLAVVPDAPSLVAVNASAQAVASVLVPATGVLLAIDAVRGGGREPVAIAAAVLVAAGFAVLVLAVSAGVAVASSGEVGGATTVVAVVLGSLGAQVTAQLVGTASGLLIRRPFVAFVATIVVPLAVWLLLAGAGPVRQWLAPFGALPPLLSGAPSARDVLAWLVVVALWGVLLNLVGLAVARRAPSTPRRAGGPGSRDDPVRRPGD